MAQPPYDPGGNQQPTHRLCIVFDDNNGMDSAAVPEGLDPGRARLVRLNFESDGALSINHSVNDWLRPQQPARQTYVSQPEDGMVLPVLATSREETTQGQVNGNQAYNNREPVRVYAEETRLPRDGIHHPQCDHLMSFSPQVPTPFTHQSKPEASGMGISSATPSIQDNYQKKHEKCKMSWMNAGYDENVARQFASRLISFVGVGKMLKCLICNQNFELGQEQHHIHTMADTRTTQRLTSLDEHLGAAVYKAPVASLLASSGEAGTISSRPARQQPPPVNNQSGLSSNLPPAKFPTPKLQAQNEDIKALLQTRFGYSEERIEAVKRKHGPKAMVSLNDFMECDSATSSINMASYEGACLQTSDIFQTALNTSVPMTMDQRSGNIPESRQYRSYGARRSTFDNPPWPKSSIQSPDDLARAGFYYKGKDDEVRCFACGVLLRRWQVQDNPWFEHARNRPECSYVLAEKGEDYVNAAMRS